MGPDARALRRAGPVPGGSRIGPADGSECPRTGSLTATRCNVDTAINECQSLARHVVRAIALAVCVGEREGLHRDKRTHSRPGSQRGDWPEIDSVVKCSNAGEHGRLWSLGRHKIDYGRGKACAHLSRPTRRSGEKTVTPFLASPGSIRHSRPSEARRLPPLYTSPEGGLHPAKILRRLC